MFISIIKHACVFSFVVLFFMKCKPSANEDWKVYGGNKEGNRYSTLDQINIDNVNKLTVAWTYNSADSLMPGENPRDIQCQPIVVDGILYGTTSTMKLFALDASSGDVLWKFDPFEGKEKKAGMHAIRGVAFWQEGNDKRLLYVVGSALICIDANNGKKIKSFGINGEVDFHEGLGDVNTIGHDVSQLSVRMTSPGIVFKDLLIVGSTVSESGDAAPGYIRAFNIKTGKLAWVFHTIPLPGEYGYETWPKDAYKIMGGANCWAGLVLDEKRGHVYAGTGSPSADFYGGDRKGQNLFANCILALDAQTGKRVWHYQTVHHDLWDRDLPCQPNLLTVKHNGKMVDALAQATKDGLVFLLNRDNGQPLFPVNEVAVPRLPSLPGESPWPTQPVPEKPAPFSLQELTENEITNRTPEARAYVLNRYNNSNKGSKYFPPSLEGSLYYGMGGGAEWGGNAVDPNGILYLNANNMLWFIQMRKRESITNAKNMGIGEMIFTNNCASCHGTLENNIATTKVIEGAPNLSQVAKRMNKVQIEQVLEFGRGRMPSFGHLSVKDREMVIDYLIDHNQLAKANQPVHTKTVSAAQSDQQKNMFPYMPPFISYGINQFRDHENYPALKTPWGTLNAIDMNTGEYLWQVPLGEYPELARKGYGNTGTENHGGPVVTAGGLLFIAATYDQKLRAFETKTGKLVWEYQLPAGGFATPMTYMVEGKQFIVIAAGGVRYKLPSGGKYIAFSLPD